MRTLYVCLICNYMQRELYEASTLNRHAAYQRIVTGMSTRNEQTSSQRDRQTDRWTPAQMNVLSRRTSRQTDGQRPREKERQTNSRQRLNEPGWLRLFFFFLVWHPANVYRVSVSGAKLSNQLIALFVFTLGFLFVCESLVQLAKALNYICPFTWFAPFIYSIV